MLKKLFYIFLSFFPLLGWADTDPRPSNYPSIKSDDQMLYKMSSFNDGRHWYLSFGDKVIIHDPECPCHNRSKYVSYKLDENDKMIPGSRRIIQKIPAYDEFNN